MIDTDTDQARFIGMWQAIGVDVVGPMPITADDGQSVCEDAFADGARSSIYVGSACFCFDADGKYVGMFYEGPEFQWEPRER